MTRRALRIRLSCEKAASEFISLPLELVATLEDPAEAPAILVDSTGVGVELVPVVVENARSFVELCRADGAFVSDSSGAKVPGGTRSETNFTTKPSIRASP